MKTAKPMIHWMDLFDKNRVPHPHFQSVIDENKIPLIGHGHLCNTRSTAEKTFLFWDGNKPEKIHTPTKDVRKALDSKIKKVNGSIINYNFAGVHMPVNDDGTILKQLQLYFKRERRRDAFGEWIWQQIQAKKHDIHYLANMITNIKFNLVYVKDPESTTSKVLQLVTPADHHDSGIYFVKEHSPYPPFEEIVYVGKSLGAMGTTIWCHFNEWNGKYNNYSRLKGSRGEDRGLWIEKILQQDFKYSIGTIKVLPYQKGFLGITDQQVRLMERIFIHLLDPRDNRLDKIVSQAELFNNLSDLYIEEKPITRQADTDDTTPF